MAEKAERIEIALHRHDPACRDIEPIHSQQLAPTPFDEDQSIVAGPIERFERHAGQMIRQIRRPQHVSLVG